MTTYDAIIIGGGHNGLVAACYLAKAGKRVLVLERYHTVGGAAITEEIHPGFRVSVASYSMSLMRPEIIEDLRLVDYGFSVYAKKPSFFVPFPDGSHLLLAVGRLPNTGDLNLEVAGVRTDPRGYIQVDDELKTSADGIWAMGDINGRGAFTHTS